MGGGDQAEDGGGAPRGVHFRDDLDADEFRQRVAKHLGGDQPRLEMRTELRARVQPAAVNGFRNPYMQA